MQGSPTAIPRGSLGGPPGGGAGGSPAWRGRGVGKCYASYDDSYMSLCSCELKLGVELK